MNVSLCREFLRRKRRLDFNLAYYYLFPQFGLTISAAKRTILKGE